MNVKQLKGVVLVTFHLDDQEKEEILQNKGDLQERAMDALKGVIDPGIVSDAIVEIGPESLQLALLLTKTSSDVKSGGCSERAPGFMVRG